jgi:hypothetical protein
MKLLLIFGLLMFSLSALSANGTGNGNQTGNDSGQTDIDDDFGSGSDEFEFEKYSNENVLSMIEEDMEFACDKAGLCTLHAVTQYDNRFTVTFNVGEGSPLSGATKPEGSVIITDGGEGLYGTQEYWGLTLQHSVGSCTQNIKVPRSLYISMNRYMYDLMDENGNTRRGFDPSKEAMIMFYSTIMKEASGCNAPK